MIFFALGTNDLEDFSSTAFDGWWFLGMTRPTSLSTGWGEVVELLDSGQGRRQVFYSWRHQYYDFFF